ncbi:DEAD/DEAH box helicase [bacterium]|nr:DEAD/DEAH box helicase [bacterium]
MTTEASNKLRTSFTANLDDLAPITLNNTPSFEYAVNRLYMALSDAHEIGPDQIVLLRQAARWSGRDKIRVDRPKNDSDELEDWLRKADIEWTNNGYLSVAPYSPKWLAGKPQNIDDIPQYRSVKESFKAESYLNLIGYNEWLSPAQKEAAWKVVNAPVGSTRIIALPTGAGKSLCFQILPLFFTGLTVVVVPTVALAIDQWTSAKERFTRIPDLNPCYFASDDNPERTVDQLKKKDSRLVFTSPETCVSGKLRPILDNFASEGWLENLVIDEAHLIETWGARFRVEFQLLASARKKWLDNDSGRLRTFLFSATMSSNCRKTIKGLFGTEKNTLEFSCQRLRPEIKYFGTKFSSQNRRKPKLLESIWRLPRPAIIYLTKPSQANDLYDVLRYEEGFQRIGCFTGETVRDQRKLLLSLWKENKIDLMVATSAFGLGVDKADIRTVIHACYPENLDRYYQEIGRGGRDGYSSISIILPTDNDKYIARQLGVRIMSDVSIIQQRWDSMYNNSQLVNIMNYIYKFPLAVKRLELLGEHTYSQNIIWNKSLLLQLDRCGLIELQNLELNIPDDSEDDLEEWATIKVNFPPGATNVSDKFSDYRKREKDYFYNGFNQVANLFSSNRCLKYDLAKLYCVTKDQRVCGGCQYCRKEGFSPGDCPPLSIPKIHQGSSAEKGTIIEQWPNPLSSNEENDFMEYIDLSTEKHSLKPFHFYCPTQNHEKLLSLFNNIFLHYNSPFRIDPFNENTVISAEKDEPLLFIHIKAFSEEMFKKSIGYNSHHFFCGILNVNEPSGRHIMIKYNCDSWPNPFSWLNSLI